MGATSTLSMGQPNCPAGKQMNYKNTESTCHSAGNMQFFEINHAGSYAAHWKYDSITEKLHLSILQYYN